MVPLMPSAESRTAIFRLRLLAGSRISACSVPLLVRFELLTLTTCIV